MKKISIVAGVIVALVIGILSVVTLNHNSTTSGGTSKTSTTTATTKKKSLIIYFSQSGTTKAAAEKIQDEIDADLIRLQPTKAYPSDYDEYVKVAQRQLKKKIHPAIKTNIPNLNDYGTIYVGFPTWWHQPPMIIYSLFDKFDFSGKTIVPFTTSMSDPISKSMPYMRRLAKKDNAKIIPGFRYDNNDQALKKFLNRNGLN